MNTNEEEFAFKIFLDLYGMLSAGEKSESPDFIINHSGERIGVELTELMEIGNRQFSTAAKYSLEDKIAKSAQKKYDLISSKKVTVNLQIVENLNISVRQIDHLASQIAEILMNTIKDIPYILSHHHEINENLPNEILNIYYDITPFLDESHFSVMRGKWTGSFDRNDLNRAISKKERYIPLYKNKVDLVYLLIVEGLSFSSYLGSFDMKGSLIDNSFDKIFLLKIMSRELYDIK